MINPNASKRVTVQVETTITPETATTIQYKGLELDLILWNRILKPGKRRLYLKYSILLDDYYLCDYA